VTQVKNRKELVLYHIPRDLLSRIQKYFCTCSKNPEDRLIPYSEHTLRNLLKKYSKSILKKQLLPHDLRRNLATHLSRGGIEVSKIQQILGHSNVTTTHQYILPINPKYNMRDVQSMLSKKPKSIPSVEPQPQKKLKT